MARPCMYKNKFTMMIIVMQLVLVVSIEKVIEEDDVAGGLRDRASLVSFLTGITSDPEGVLENWNSTSVHVCNWTGVFCNTTRWRVMQLDLSGRSLTGSISDSLSNLFFLVVLDLSNNFFTGEIPTGIDRLPNLTQLSLGSNQLEGPIPAQLGSSNQLVYVELSSNLLTGTVPETLLCNCSTLEYIDLSNNSLSGSISFDDHCELTELRVLLLWSNLFTGPIPPSLSKSTKLRWMDLESNYLSGELPSGIVDKMSSLTFLHLSYNNFTSHDHNTNLEPFLASLSNCPLLTELEIAGNGLGGVIPFFIGNLSINLVQLQLQENKIEGPIPPNISNLLNLTYLNLSNNFLNGSIPPDLAQLRRLERVFLSNNLLSGHIPSDIGSLPHLGLLDISGNKLSGSIPDTSNLSQLRRLLLHHNNLSGTIPASLGNCNNLEILDLSHNSLTGQIPKEIAGLSSLTLYLNLSSNSLEGPLPLELSKMDMMIELDLSSNNLAGIIPSQLGSCVALESLNLSHNNFNGPLAESIGKLPFLELLDVSVNRLSGPLPESLQKSTTIRTLNVSYNHFAGYVPRKGVFASLSSNSFEGNAELCGELSGMQPCTANRPAGRFPMLFPVLLSVIGIPCFICVWVYFIKRSRSVTRIPCLPLFTRRAFSGEEEEKETKVDYPRIPYRQLVEATGGFEGSNLVGSGSFGRVYKGTLRDDRRIAVKVLDPKMGGEVFGSFKRECEVLKRTRHRNLIRIITTCSRPDFKALVLPYMSNGSLESQLYPSDGSFCGLSLAQMVTIASDIAEGMAYLHHYSPVRVVHCDLKPSNVLLDEDMTAVVSDFGIAKLVKGADEVLDASACNSLTGLLRGSVGYIAPEYGTGGHPSTQGDVYSFGVILLEIITGKRPTDILFQEGSTLQEWVKSHYPHNLQSIVQDSLFSSSSQTANMAGDVAVELVELGLVCTQISPSTRPTMADVAHEIGQLKDDLTRVAVANTDESSSLPDSSF